MSREDSFVFFDFDGVIADTNTIAFQLGQVRCPGLTEEDHRRKFEGNVHDWDRGEFTHTDACRHDMNWWESYIPQFLEAPVFPGIVSAIEEIAEEHRLAVISSTLSSGIDAFLKKIGLREKFAEIMGSDVHHQKDEKIRMLLSKYHLEPENCLFVTDTLGDMREAAHEKVASIGVSWGFHDLERLKQGNPFRIVDRPDDLPLAVNDFFKTHAESL